MAVKVSPLAPKTVPDMPSIAGVRLATVAAGVRYQGRKDVLMMLMDKGTTAAGVFTKSKCPSAPVDWCREVLKKGKARALVVNSGNANAFTGRKGRAGTQATAKAAAKAAGCAASEVYLASTGVIGEPLPAERIAAVMDEAAAAAAPARWMDAAQAIMTTDTFPKVSTRTLRLGGGDISINGIAKGAGMIAPDMATMLAFVFTDAPVAADVLQKALSSGTEQSFNAVTVDSDTSTSDTVLLFATGRAQGIAPLKSVRDRRFAGFRKALHEVMQDLAVQIARDGEGASKLIRVTVKGAASKASARKIAFSIANSPLVKTAVAGQDANWGRVVMAVGKAGEPADRDKLAIWFGPHRVAARGERDPDYDEAVLSDYMKIDEISITADLRLGKGEDTVWTCDLTHDYITINGSYRS